MDAVHLALLALSCCCLAAGAAGGRWLTAKGGDARQIQTMAFVIGSALVVGNAACLLPSAPDWYSITMVAATAAGLCWLLVTVAGAREPSTVVSLDAYRAQSRPTEPLRLVRGMATTTAERDLLRTVVTSDMIHRSGPPESRRAASQTVYVAANLGAYLPERRDPRRRHAVANPTRHAQMNSAATRARLAATYADRTEHRPGDGHSTMA